MYQTPLEAQQDERAQDDYLLGKKAPELKSDNALKQMQEAPGSLFAKPAAPPASANDLKAKLRDDPLMLIKQREVEHLRGLSATQAHMHRLREQALEEEHARSSHKDRKEDSKHKDKHKHKRHKSHHRHSDSDDEERRADKKRRREERERRHAEEEPERKKPKLEDDSTDRIHRSEDRHPHDSHASRSDSIQAQERREHRERSPPRHSRDYDDRYASASHQSASSSSHPQDRDRYDRRGHDYSPRRERYPPQNRSDYFGSSRDDRSRSYDRPYQSNRSNRNAMPEPSQAERARMLEEMQRGARELDTARSALVVESRAEDEREQRTHKEAATKAQADNLQVGFIADIHQEALRATSLEDRVARSRYYLQKTE